jgi:arginine exporter protein ArgO
LRKEAKLFDESDPESQFLMVTIRLKAAERFAFSLSTVANMLHLFTTCRARETNLSTFHDSCTVLRILNVFSDRRMTKLYFALIYMLFPNPFSVCLGL